MRRMSVRVALGLGVYCFTVGYAGALTYQEILGRWTSETTNEFIEFRPGGDVLDARLGQGRFSTNVISNAANAAVVYQGNRWCYYYISLTVDGRSMLLARRNERQDPWLCIEGRFSRTRQ
jgi:hypothetical protein